MIANSKKVAAAQQVLAQAKELGFEDAYLTYCDEEGTLYESVEDIAGNTLATGEVTASIHLILDDELNFLIEEEPPKVTFAP